MHFIKHIIFGSLLASCSLYTIDSQEAQEREMMQAFLAFKSVPFQEQLAKEAYYLERLKVCLQIMEKGKLNADEQKVCDALRAEFFKDINARIQANGPFSIESFQIQEVEKMRKGALPSSADPADDENAIWE